MPDLKSSKAIYLKGFLFLAILLMTGTWLIFEAEFWKRAVLVLLLIWSSARFYYFMFYVIENYVDKEYKFAGILDFVRYLFSKPK